MTLVRDRLTWLIYLRLAAYGWFLFAFTALQPLLREEQGTSGVVAGLHGTFFAIGVIAAGLCNAAIVHRFGTTRGTTISLIVFSAGVAVLALAGPVQWTLIGATLAGFGGSVSLNLQQPILLRHHRGPAGEQAFAEGTGVGGVLGIISVGSIGVIAAADGPWRSTVLLMTIGWLVIARIFFGTAPADEHQPNPEGREQGSLGSAYWIRWFGLVVMIATEFALSFWAASLISERTGTALGSSTGLVMVFAAGMGVGRIGGGRLVHAFSTDRLLLAAIFSTLVAFIVFWTSANIVLSMIALFVVGASLAMFYPLGVVRMLAAAPTKPALAFGQMGFGVGCAIAVSPVLLGALSDQVGVVSAYGIVPVFLILAGAVVLISPSKSASASTGQSEQVGS